MKSYIVLFRFSFYALVFSICANALAADSDNVATSSAAEEDSSALAEFEVGPDMPVARMGHHVATLPDGRAALFGGHGQGFVSLSSADFWTPGENSFSSKVMNQTHDSSIFTRLADGRYLLSGGSSDLGVPAYAYSEIYDPVADAFTPSGNMV